jgi:hypothetical protein
VEERERNDNEQEGTRRGRRVIGEEGDDEEVSMPTREEVEKCIQKTKNIKAPGEESIIAELIKYGGEGIIDAMHKLITMIWITEEMPQSWNTGIICPILIKGDKFECGSYRGITLLNLAYKILSSVINGRLMMVTEKIFGEYQ